MILFEIKCIFQLISEISWIQPNKSLDGRFFPHWLVWERTGVSAWKTHQKGTNFKRLIDNKHTFSQKIFGHTCFNGFNGQLGALMRKKAFMTFTHLCFRSGFLLASHSHIIEMFQIGHSPVNPSIPELKKHLTDYGRSWLIKTAHG